MNSITPLSIALRTVSHLKDDKQNAVIFRSVTNNMTNFTAAILTDLSVT